jgi:hypothetical protein
VDQISPPFRIALVAMLAVCALWFTVLKPKDPAAEPAPATTAPGTTGLANDVNAAKGAADASNAANAKVQKATGATAAPKVSSAATPAKAGRAHAAVAGKHAPTAPATKKAAPTADPAAPLLSALDRKHTVVLLFWNRKGSDDRAVRRAVSGVDRRHGHVVVRTVPVSKIGEYEAITAGAQVMQSPTVLVIGADHKAKAIAGFTTTAELDQAAGDALAAAKK